MPNRLMITLCLAACAAPAGAAKADRNYVYGPPPTWERFRELAETAVLSMLVDPDSAKFTWTEGYRKGGYKPFLEGAVYGYVACGFVNSRNRMGGYAGQTNFLVAIDKDRVIRAELGKSSASDYITAVCEAHTRRGLFPPISDMPTASGPPPSQRLGFRLADASDGVRVIAVIEGSDAHIAGLRDGTTISHINGLAVKGMTLDTVQQLLGAASDAINLTLSDGREVRIMAGSNKVSVAPKSVEQN